MFYTFISTKGKIELDQTKIHFYTFSSTTQNKIVVLNKSLNAIEH